MYTTRSSSLESVKGNTSPSSFGHLFRLSHLATVVWQFFEGYGTCLAMMRLS